MRIHSSALTALLLFPSARPWARANDDDPVACCVRGPDTGPLFTDCENVTRANCTAKDGVPSLFGEMCNDITCASFGACCEFEEGGTFNACFDKVSILGVGEVFCRIGLVPPGATRYFAPGVNCSIDEEVGCQLGACCNGNGCSNGTRAQCISEAFGGAGTFLGNGTSCEENSCELGACCRAEGKCKSDVPRGACQDADEYFSPGGNCSDSTCSRGACCSKTSCTPQAYNIECGDSDGQFVEGGDCGLEDTCKVGACCRGEGDCEDDVLEADCQDTDEYFKPGGNCTNSTCSRGACCEETSCAPQAYNIECGDSGGQFEEGKDCDEVEGACVDGACCAPEGDCSDANGFACASSKGTYLGTETSCGEEDDICKAVKECGEECLADLQCKTGCCLTPGQLSFKPSNEIRKLSSSTKKGRCIESKWCRCTADANQGNKGIGSFVKCVRPCA